MDIKRPQSSECVKSDKGRALWYALKVKDYELARHLVETGAPIDRAYEIAPNKYLSTITLLVMNMAKARVSKTHKSTDYKVPDRILDLILENVPPQELRCHCSPKYSHRCPLYHAIIGLGIKGDADMILEKNYLIVKLLTKGGTFKNINPKGKKLLPDIDLDSLTQYIIEKQRFNRSNTTFRESQNNISSASNHQNFHATFGQK